MVCGQVALDEQSLAIFVIHIDAHPVVQIQVNKNNSKVDIYIIPCSNTVYGL